MKIFKHTSEEYEDILYKYSTLRWLARVMGTIEAALILWIAFNEFREEIVNNSPSPLVTMINGQYLLAILLTAIFIGLVLAWWKEGLGGGIALVAYIVIIAGFPDSSVMFILSMALAASPPILYVVYGISVYRDLRKVNRDQDGDS